MDTSDFTENEIATIIVNCCYQIHTRLGPGLLESAYRDILVHVLTRMRLSVETEKPVPIIYDSLEIGEGFRADLVINDKVIVELKSVEAIAPVHKKQLLTYLRLSDKKLGLLVNFGANLIKDGICRVANGL